MTLTATVADVSSAVTATQATAIGIAVLWLLAMVVFLALLYAFGERHQRAPPDAERPVVEASGVENTSRERADTAD
jgi:uncharacterized protein (DUF58 family)